jgi:hypothetical protein
MAEMSITAALALADEHRKAGRTDQAESVYRQILQSQPNVPGAWVGLGDLASNALRFDEAINFFQRAIVVNPKSIRAHLGLGWALLNLHQTSQAADAYRTTIALEPECADAHYGLSWALLAQGDFAEGWVEHQWRAQCRGLAGPSSKYTQPQWDGSDLAGRTVLLYQEQGAGDVIQYLRYVPMVAARGGRIILGCDIRLAPLLKNMPGVADCGFGSDAIPPFDVHLSLHELPRIFKTTLETIPANVPYLRADAERIERWRSRIDRREGMLHIGLCWAGSTKHKNDRLRSIPLREFAALAGDERIRCYSLQKGPAATQLNSVPQMRLIDCNVAIEDWADTAAAMEHLDLVITVDTSIAHLAGAIARPVWTLLPFHADWRWLLDREDSPWYPTMRLFRQKAIGDWSEVLTRVRNELSGSSEYLRHRRSAAD